MRAEGEEYKVQFFIQVHTCYSANPIPARSPAEREGQTRKMGRVEGGGGDDGEEEEEQEEGGAGAWMGGEGDSGVN